MQNNKTEDFQTSLKKGVVSGSLKFSNKFTSWMQLYTATKEWEKEDKGLIYASIRTDGEDFIALDFRYDENLNDKKFKSILYDFLKPLFQKKLNGDYIQAWSISRETLIIK